MLRGQLVAMAPEREPHAYYSSEAGAYWRAVLGNRAEVRETHPIALAADSEPVPDLAIVRPLGRTYLERHPTPSDVFWLIEFASTTLATDLTVKRSAYAAAGIPEYWVVNLKEDQLHRFIDCQAGQYVTEQILTAGTMTPLAFPDLAIAIPRFTQP